jgi:hypothetical protein
VVLRRRVGDGNAGAEGFGRVSWVPLTEDRLNEEDIGEDGANGRG